MGRPHHLVHGEFESLAGARNEGDFDLRGDQCGEYHDCPSDVQWRQCSFVVFPQTDTTYNCTATSGNGTTATQSLTVHVTTVTPPNLPPGPTVVVAGGLSQTTIYRIITLDASVSNSPNPPLTLQRTVVSGTPTAISDANTPMPTVQLGNESCEYDLNLTVTDSQGGSTTVTVRINLLATHVQSWRTR